MTYSIIGRDATTGELGVAVQTGMFAVGAAVPWARAGVGAVATQSITEVGYGPRCLDLLAAGADAEAALDQTRVADPLAVLRQVAVIDANGRVGAFTGELCIDEAGHHIGDGYSVQANMAASPRVWPAMAEAYEAATGSLAARMLAALRAAQAAGGDARGQMSSAMVVVEGQRHDEPWAGVTIDIRVDRDPAPLDELGRLLDAAVAYRACGQAVDALIGGRPRDALDLVNGAAQALPTEGNFDFLRVGALAAADRVADAQQAMQTLLAVNPGWARLARSFAAKGLINLPVDLDPGALRNPAAEEGR
jgi:uncharacterized Ntn-hydrolase superfamily protein